MMIGLGLWLGPAVGMGQIEIADDSTGALSARQRALNLIVKPLLIGIMLGSVIVAFLSNVQVTAPKEKAITLPQAWEGLLASIGAGIRGDLDEIRSPDLFGMGRRFVTRRFARGSEQPSVAIFWIANVLAALGFAAIHIPRRNCFWGLPPGMIAFIFVGNGVPALVFGWLYWHRGLIAAMIASFGLDLVLKVFVPLFS